MFWRVIEGWFALAYLAAFGLLAAAQEPQLAPATGDDPEGIETLTQGPIHEAFANPTDLDPTPGPIVMRQPPPDIQEEPPEFMPEDSSWIGGYWVWDDERDDFVWVTGVARKTPPGMRYVPGYWTEAEGGWQRVSGFWTSAEATEIAYRPPPPNSLEAGPSSPAPADNYFWVPGNWIYYDAGYRWRAGYWTPYQPDWVWVPARWVWTPGGFVYLPGFWDFQLAFRGQFFAPVYFQRPVYLQPRYVYRPWCVIPTGNLFIHLWIRPSHCHYYFGNYYGPRYASRGFQSWCQAPAHRHYDPLFTYCSVHYRRQGIDYVGRVRGWHDHYEHHEDHRPPRTWHEQVARRNQPRGELQTQLVARNIREVAERNDAPVRLTKLDAQTRQAQFQRTKELQQLNVSRKNVEREAAQVASWQPRPDRERSADAAPRTEREKSTATAERALSRPAGIDAPKLKLPKEATASGAVVRSEGGVPGGHGPRGKGQSNKGPGASGDRLESAGRTDVARDLTIPPPLKGNTNAAGPERTGRSGGPTKAAERFAEGGGGNAGAKPPKPLPPGNPGVSGSDEPPQARPKNKGRDGASDDGSKAKAQSPAEPQRQFSRPPTSAARGTDATPPLEIPRENLAPKPNVAPRSNSSPRAGGTSRPPKGSAPARSNSSDKGRDKERGKGK